MDTCSENDLHHQQAASPMKRLSLLLRLFRGDGPDRGRSWLVALACSWVTMVTYGFIMAGGVFFVVFKDTFHLSRKQASWPGSLLFASVSLSAPLVAILCNHFSLRKVSTLGSLIATTSVALCYFATEITMLSVLFGFLQGIGYSLLTNPAFLIINLYFKRHRVTANGIQQAGGSIGCFMLPPLITAIVSKFGLHIYFLFMSALLITSLGATALFTPPQWLTQNSDGTTHIPDSSNKNTHDNVESDAVSNENDSPLLNIQSDISEVPLLTNPPTVNVSDMQHEAIIDADRMKMFFIVLRHPMFWVIQLVYICLGVGLPMYGQVFIDYAGDRGIDKTVATYLVSASSILDLTGRLGTGWITDLGFLSRKTLIAIMCFLIGAFCMSIPFIPNSYIFVAMSLCLSFAGGTLVALVHVVHAEYLGLQNLVLTIALAQFVSGFLTLLTPYVIGYFRDSVGSYQGLLILVAGMGLFTSFMWLLEPTIVHHWKKIPQDKQYSSLQSSYGTV